MTCESRASHGLQKSEASYGELARQQAQQQALIQAMKQYQGLGAQQIGSYGLGQAPKQAPTNLTTGNTWGSWLKGLLP